MQIGILRETKLPVERRTALTPQQVHELSSQYPEHEFIVQGSEIRAFTDDEYAS